MFSEDIKNTLAVVIVATFFSLLIAVVVVSLGALIYFQPIPISIAAGIIATFGVLLWAANRCDKLMTENQNPNE